MTPLGEGVLEELSGASAPDPGLAVRSLFTGGDRLHWRPGPGVGFRLWNTYGPAEYTVTTSAVAVSAPTAPPAAAPAGSAAAALNPADLPSIGRAPPHTRIYVLDRARQPVPAGVPRA